MHFHIPFNLGLVLNDESLQFDDIFKIDCQDQSYDSPIETNCSFMLEQIVLPYWNTLFCLDKTDCSL